MMTTTFSSPRVMKETSAGYFFSEIRDEMFRSREIECVGEINDESVYSLCRQLRQLQREDPNKEITMFINSPGGEVTSGLALYDVMAGLSCPIRTICLGMAASMGSILFIAGKQRDILPHGRVMIHDPLRMMNGRVTALQLQEEGRQLMQTREILCKILSQRTNRTLKEIYEKTKHDSYFDAEEAVAFGLADRVIQHV